jgi:hypothetical protein
MNIKLLFLASIFLVFFTNIIAQKKTATFKDGTKIDYEILKNHTDQMTPFTMDIYFEYPYNNFINLSYFIPKICYTEVNTNGSGGGIGSLFFFHSFEKTKTKKMPIASNVDSRGGTVFVVKDDLIKKTYIGGHIEYNYLSNNSFIETQTHEIAIGLGLFSGKFVRLVSDEKRKRKLKTTLSIYSDLLIYSDSSTVTPPIGFRVVGQTRTMGSMLGLTLKLGVVYYDKIYPIIGAGFLTFF